VDICRAFGEWGSRLSSGTHTYIITGYDHERFVETLVAA
jgi:hypothetical protein